LPSALAVSRAVAGGGKNCCGGKESGRAGRPGIGPEEAAKAKEPNVTETSHGRRWCGLAFSPERTTYTVPALLHARAKWPDCPCALGRRSVRVGAGFIFSGATSPGGRLFAGAQAASGLFGYFFQDPVILDLDCPVIIIF
jgi:hypothetical protein